jgi:hypothetical protein
MSITSDHAQAQVTRAILTPNITIKRNCNKKIKNTILLLCELKIFLGGNDMWTTIFGQKKFF